MWALLSQKLHNPKHQRKGRMPYLSISSLQPHSGALLEMLWVVLWDYFTWKNLCSVDGGADLLNLSANLELLRSKMIHQISESKHFPIIIQIERILPFFKQNWTSKIILFKFWISLRRNFIDFLKFDFESMIPFFFSQFLDMLFRIISVTIKSDSFSKSQEAFNLLNQVLIWVQPYPIQQ